MADLSWLDRVYYSKLLLLKDGSPEFSAATIHAIIVRVTIVRVTTIADPGSCGFVKSLKD
jgi:hypothetical protein